MADCYISNADQPRGHCGHFVEVLETGKLTRVRCNQCNEYQTLWHERI